MSLLKQMEELKITPEEIQELLDLLKDVLPKIEHRVGKNKALETWQKNVSSKLQGVGTGGFENAVLKDLNSLAAGFDRLKSVKTKLEKFKEVIGEVKEG